MSVRATGRPAAAAGAVAAVDLGATSGRVVVGRVSPDGVEIEDVHRFPNRPVRTRDGLHWDVLDLYRNVIEGLRTAFAAEPGIVSIGIDSWAVDYALLRGDRMLGVPFHYRDERTARGVAAVDGAVDAETLHAASGLQFLPFNTLYQLAADRDDGVLDVATGMLLIPDLIAFWLTGERRAERTNASTTGLLDVTTGTWHDALIGALGYPRALFAPLVEPGERIGVLTPDVAARIGCRPVPVVAVGSHDTASAVVAVPMTTRDTAYICSGTWSLIGVETDEPVLTPEARAANFTNEGGVDGRTRFLRNTMGMWLVNECVAAWRAAGRAANLPTLLGDAATVHDAVLFDVEDPSLVPAGDMPSRIVALAPGLAGASDATVLRSIVESLAVQYARTLDDLERLTGTRVATVHVVGGASLNELLCRRLAAVSGSTVVAGPVEATATGNVLVQARAAGLVDGRLEDLRALVAASTTPRTYTPSPREDA
ncbi:rhamnulokinase [Luteimicrobium subarcticum]|uniref:Rhamnulokinase n=1 Tax=Luteimicrobium subarcticum TaxID=620910 RepID=A0A2M8WJN7_9MICO|nr:rhamnulokinase family protein [Luteimicrobium subarcticum]PJI91135.1 rhamnulokinase [Luteimicrobium subarcticum]